MHCKLPDSDEVPRRAFRPSPLRLEWRGTFGNQLTMARLTPGQFERRVNRLAKDGRSSFRVVAKSASRPRLPRASVTIARRRVVITR